MDAISSIKNETLNVQLPTSWRDLTESQLHYICLLLSLGTQLNELKIYAFVRFSGLDVVSKSKDGWIFRKRISWRKNLYFVLDIDKIGWGVAQLAFLDEFPKTPIRVSAFGKFKAENALLLNVSFGKYLRLENLWQRYLESKDDKILGDMTKILYTDAKGNGPEDPNVIMKTSTMLWFSSFKEMCYVHWPHLFKSNGKSSGKPSAPINMEQIMNAQIRSLTQGDVTKEEKVLNLDLWRALTELDAKAEDASETKKQMAKYKAK